ncbi:MULTISPECIES: tape measure protein [Methylobacter]
MSNELTLKLRIATSNDGTAQALGQTSEGIKRVSTEAQNASHNVSDMARTLSAAGERGSASAQRITAGMSSVSTSAQTASRSIYETSGSITAGMASAASSTQISAASIANSLRQASSVGRASIQSMTESMVSDLHTISATLTALDARLAATEARTVGTMAASTSATNSAAAGYANLKGIVAILGLGMLAKDILDTNREFESLRMQLNGVMGSAEAGAMAFDESMKWAVKTPFELKDITQAFITLKNFGIDPTSSTMESITNQAARLGKGAQGLTTLTMQLGQAWTKGKLQMQDMHIMMEAGVPVIDMLKTVTGKTGAEIADMSEKGDLGRESIKGLIDEMGRLTAGSNAAAMQTLNGQISNLSDAWHNFEDTLLQDKSEGLIKNIVASMTDSMNLVTRNMSSSIDAQIAHSEARIKTLESMGVVGSFVSDMTGSDANLEKNRLAGLKRIKTALDEANQLITINKDTTLAIKDTWDWLAEIESADAEKSDKVAKEKAKKAKSEAESAAKSLQSAYDNAVNSLEKEISMRGSNTKSAAMEYEVTAGSLAKLTEAQKLKLLQDAAEVDNQALLKSSGDAQKYRMDALIDKYNQLTMSARAYYATTLKDKDGKALSPELAAPLVQQFDKNSAAEAGKKSVDDARTSLEAYNKTLADTTAKTTDLGATNSAIFDSALGGLNTMTGAFDNMIKSISANTKALDELHKQQKANTNFEKTAITDVNRARNNGQYLVDLKTIADNKRTYALEEKYLNIENLKDSLTGIRQSASAMGSMFAENTTARKAFNIVSLAASISERMADIAQLEVKAALAVLTQGQGDPYTAFARIAAMGAIVASILSAAGSGTFNFGGSASSPGPQGLSSDTGTVLGAASAKSQSIDNTYQLLKDIQAENYPVLKSIDQGIADLHSGITDVITRLFQAGGLTAVNAPAAVTGNYGMVGNAVQMGAMLGSGGLAKFDPISNYILGGIFGGKQTSTVTAQGLATTPTSIMDIVAGKNLNAQQFAQIETKTDGGWFGKDKYSTSTQYAALDASTQKALNDVFSSMGKTMMGLADNLGMGLSDRVKNYIIPALNVDLKGLNGEDAAKKLNGVISAALDTMSTSVFGDLLGQYQQLGEGMLETAVRVVSEVAVVKDSLAKSGLSITGDAIAISDGLAQAAGGLKEFQKEVDAYYQKFYTDAERNVFTQKQLAGQLSDVNLLLPATRDGYRQLIEALNINNAADQERYSLLLKLSGAADTYYTGVETAAKAAQQISDQQRTLDIQLMEASGNAIGALTEKRKDELAAMDASLRFSQQAIWAMTSANDAVTKAVDGVSKSISNLTSLATKLRSALGSTAVTSDASTRQDRLSAQSVLQSALIIAKSGGSIDNIAGMDKALTDIAKPSESLYSTFVDYARDQGRTANTISQLADYADTQVSMAQQQLNAVNGTTDAVLSVKDAVSNLATALNIKEATLKAISVAQNAAKSESSSKLRSDSAAATAAQSAAAVANAVATATRASQAAASAAARAAAMQQFAPAPATWQAGQSGNAIWEQVLGQFNAAHAAKYGIAMNRPWSADADAANQYQALVAQYNASSVAAAAAATSTAAGLANVAAASAALIPGYSATAAVDQAAASQAAAAYATASSYAAAARAAVPGINSFEVGTNYVVDERWAKIHPGERIMPAADNKELMMRLSEPRSDSNNSEVVAELKALRAEHALLREEVVKLRAETRATASHTNKTARILERVTPGGDAVTVRSAP